MLPILRPPKFDLDELARIQGEVAKRVSQRDGFGKLETVAGCDVSFTRGELAYAACAAIDYETLELLDYRTKRVKLKLPYIPTYLAFRELEAVLKVVKDIEADVYMVGAQGLAHPRRAGFACHLGVTIERPVLGVAKSRLYGEAKMPADRKGSYSLLKDGRETIGAVVRTKVRSKPVYVSVGHKISIKSAVEVAVHTSRDNRLPQPIVIAHQLASEAMSRRGKIKRKRGGVPE